MQQRKTRTNLNAQTAAATVGDHLRELQWRLFAVVVAFVVLAGAAFPFFNQIAEIIVRPLGQQGQLVYLTPGGAFGFMMQVCCYVGLIGSLPVMLYHLYRFVMPAVREHSRKRVMLYTGASVVLAMMGVAFAYYLCLPAALNFLTSFNLEQISAMLTIDSYLSFVMTYLLVGAFLFQLPLVMLIINSVTPIKPSQLWSVESKVILGSFIAAAIISPTPDALNQIMLASPIIVMYQIGFGLVIWRNRHLHSKNPRKQFTTAPRYNVRKQDADVLQSGQMQTRNTQLEHRPKNMQRRLSQTGSSGANRPMASGKNKVSQPSRRTGASHSQSVRHGVSIPARAANLTYGRRQSRRSIDGIFAASSHNSLDEV